MTVHVDSDDLVRVPPERMEAAYLEYRRACYDVLRRQCAARGLLDLLRTPVTADEFGRRMGVVPTKLPIAELLLRALAKHGDVTRVEGDPPRYAAVASPTPRDFDDDLVRLATGRGSLTELRHSQSYAGILDALTVEGDPIAADFTAGAPPEIEEIFTIPFYRWCRLQAVHEALAAGPRVLDLACGPGYGLLEIADRLPADPRAAVFGVELTPHYAEAAMRRTAGDDRVAVVRGDLQRPQEYLRDGHFDGALIVGAYHFLREPEPLWATVARALRPGGVFALGYVQSDVATDDREIMDLRFALRKPPVYRPTPQDIDHLAARYGLTPIRRFGLGVWRSYSFRRA
ncbi:class I SAM-dependent methyltransferase [Micromonospora olivasterospora]|uniref:Methyltransferase family protein n=1 Tax=Micromonospora olivasterospora TaxID=1880 RepID=A0A562I3C8_MICOL|nr:class I SAM-dependent methyltransferase [Micromonospora olivasterospora]TWH65123.1 methyltransferase family protein [Micromonospora olivasterospora]